MAWENLLKKGMAVFGEEHELKNSIDFSLLHAIDPFPSYYFIFNCEQSEIEYTSPEIKNVLGYEQDELNIKHLMAYIHPEDHAVFIAHETKALEFCQRLKPELQEKYYILHDFRMKTKSGDFIRIQQRSYACEIKNGVVKKTMVVHSDISSLKNDGQAELNFIGIDGQPSYYNVPLQDDVQTRNNLFTKTEQQILQHVVKGKTSKAIAKELHRSVFTVQTHRKNILKKSGCNSVQELLVKSIQEGWV